VSNRSHEAFFFWVGVVFVLLCVHCTSTRRPVDNTILEHQQQVVELEGRNQELERRIASYDNAVGSAIRALEDIGERSRGMEGEIDEIISLFDEYQRRVDELSRAYNAIKNQTINSD
jgi:chromosome segregation ATPase